MSKVKFFLQQSWLLIVASFLFGVLIAVANASWSEKIDYNLKVYKFNKAAILIFPEADKFEIAIDDIQIESKSGKKTTTSVRKAVTSDGTCIGWAFIGSGMGYDGAGVTFVLAVDAEFKTVKGYGVISSNETPSIGGVIKTDKFKNQFIGAPAGEFTLAKTGDWGIVDNEIVAQSGATMSSTAVVEAFNLYLPQVKEKMQEEGLL